MSRIGKAPITVPAGVTVSVGSDNVVTVKGPKGELKQPIDRDITVSVADGSISNVSAYEKLLTVVDEEIKKVGSTLDSSAKPSLATYASAILAGTKLAVMQSPTVQNSIVEILQTAAAASTGQASTTAVATSMSTVLKGFATDVKTALGSASANEIKIFKANTYDPATIPDPKTYVPTVFGGIKSIAFTDQDSTIAIGGTVLITPPTSEAGIDSYNVYFGGANLSDSRLSLITNILKKGSTLSYAIASGTLIATSVTNIWVYPVAAGKELDLPAETTLVNTIAPPGVPTSPGAVGGLASTVISWNPVASASAYTIYWSTTNSVTSSSQKITNATSPYTHNGLSAGTDYFYAISATKDGREGSLSNVVQARTSAALSFSGSLSLGKTQC
ncbi:MAG: 50S ribosomal protein L6, partial [Proteobacteria bacterium]